MRLFIVPDMLRFVHREYSCAMCVRTNVRVEMLQCFAHVVNEAEVWVWQEEGLQ